MKSLCVKSDGEVHSTRLEEYAEDEDGMCSRSESRIKRLRNARHPNALAKFHASDYLYYSSPPSYLGSSATIFSPLKFLVIQEYQPSNSLTITRPI
jgi:hypothetical protein